MPVVDTNDHTSKPNDKKGDQTGDQTQQNSQKTDERMRSEVGDTSNKSWWQAVADKHRAVLPALAIDGPLSADASGNPTAAATTDARAQPAPPKLDQETVEKYAQELHKAINRDDNGVLGIGGGDDPDNKKITDLLDSLTAADRKAIEDAYVNTDGNKKHKSLRDELQSNLDGDDWRKAEAILNRRDGRTNDAGNLMVALSAINDDRGDAERRVMETFSTLNKDQQKLLEDDFKKDYGMTVDEALKKYDVSGDAMKAIGFLRKPVEERTAKDIEDFAHFAIDKKNLDYFGIALRGDTPAAKEARETLSKDEDFKKQINDAFKPHRDGGFLGGLKNAVSFIPGGDLLVGGFNLVEGLAKGDLDFDRLTEGTTIDKLRSAVSSKEINSEQLQAMDILHSGHVSLATIAADNTGSIFGWFDNEKAIGNAADNATDGERQLFSKGYEIAKNGGNATTDEDKNALNFYNQVHKAFDDASGGKDAAKWEDKLLNGKGGSIISAVADGDGENGRFAAVEGLSKEDWEKLKDPKSGPQFRKEIEEYLGKFTDKDETPRLLELLDKKVAADTFEDSQKINRSLFDVIQQNKGHDFLVFGTDYDGKNVTAAIAGLSADESAKYKNDSGFRSDVDKFVNDNLDGAEKAYAKRLLSQVAETGNPPKQDAVTTLLSDKVNGVEAKDAIGDVEAALKDDKLRQRLADNKDLTDEEKSIKSIIDGYVQQSLLAKFGPAAGEGGVQQYQKDYLDTLYSTGRLSVEQKAELGLRTKDFFIDAATASPEERQKLYDSKLVNDDDKKLIDTLVKQGGKMDLADEIRSFVLKDGTDVESFGDKLKALTPEQKQELRDEYTKKFGSTIDDDLLGKVSEADRNNFRTYLTATNVDGRQDFYDNLERALKSESGSSPDGSQEVLDRSLTDQAAMLSDFQSKFEQLPADKQELANKYFSEALKDYQTSKEEFAEKLYQVAVIVGGIAVGVATGGVGLAALATVAVVGAVGRVALKKVIEGNDYDLSLSNVLKDGAIGAITAGASVIGPETIGAFAGVGTVAAERFATVAGEQLLEQGLKQGGKEIIEKEATNLIAHAVVRGEPITEQAISQVIDKAAVSGISQSERTALEAALKTSIEDGGRTVSEQAIKSTLAGTVRQAGVFGTIGGTANVLIEGSVGLANGNLDISSLPTAFATGFAVGSTLSVGFEAVSRGAAHFKSGGPEAPAGTSEHLDLNFTKAEDGSIKITAPEGKDIDLTVKVDGQEQTIHVDSKGTKLPDGAEDIGIKNAEIKTPEVKALDDSGTVLAPKQDTLVPAAPVPADVSAGGPEGGLINKFKRWLNGSAAETQTQPLQFTKLADTRVTVDGQAVPVNNGTVKIGRETISDITDTRVSRNQGLLRWNEADKSYYFTDTSSNGTYVRDGDSYARLPKGQEVKLNPDQEIRLGSVNGPKLEFFNLNQASPIPLVDRQVYINGESTGLQNGSLELGRSHQTLGSNDLVTQMVSKNHGTLNVDPVSGEYVYTDHSSNGSYIKHADGTYQYVKGEQVTIKPNDEIHLGFKDGPTVKVQDTMGRQLSDGSVLYRRAEGDWIAKNDGTRVLDDRAGSRVTFDANNRVTNADSAYGVGTKFDYAENGQLKQVQFANGSRYSTTDGVNWKIENVGQPESTYVGKISVESNGALRFEDPATGRATIRNIDGSEEIRVPGRQVEYTKANYQIENQKLDALVKYSFPDEAQASRFTGLMREFESRGLPPTEVAETYRQVSRLLSSGDGSTLGLVERTRLSEQILFEAAHPEWIDQGFNNTCNVTTLETRAFERDPASAARLITDVALTGKYVTPEGVTVDVGRTGGLTPDAESMASLQQPFKPNNRYADVSIDGKRTFAGQIFENTAVNIHYADLMSGSVSNRGSYVYEPGDVIQYKKVAPTPGQVKDTGERLVAYRTDANGNLQEIPISNEPHIYTHDLHDIYNRIVPSTDSTGAPITGTDSGFLVQGPHLGSDGRILSAQTPTDLQNILLDAKNQGKLPIVLYVDSRDPIFWRTATSNPGGAGGAHVITVENVHWEPGPNGTQVLKADYYNQWGIVSNKVGKDAVDINDLYRATILRDKDGNFPAWGLQYVKNPPPPPPPKPVLTAKQLAKLPPPPNPFPAPNPFPPPNPFPQPNPFPAPLPKPIPPNPSPFAPAPSN
ncbi:MAG: FHA domain-containing protein [Cyanobacteria bacterium SZAS-4]|nr:FHA domain-containing protein [Cyanobacteria bacterium SZAS-4]